MMRRRTIHLDRRRPTTSITRLLAFALIPIGCIVAMTACSIQIGSPSSSAASGSSGAGTTVKVKIAQGQGNSTLVLLPVTIDGKGPYTFALDTGASTSLIDKPLAQKLNLQAVGTPQPIAGVSGQEQAVPVQIKQWHVEKINLPASTVSSANLFGSQRSSGIQGLIGSDIWQKFGKITIDYTAGTLTTYQSAARLRSQPRILLTTAEARRLPGVTFRVSVSA